MKKSIINTIIEYFSLTMILSYILVHNIYYVFVGMIFSVYIINIKLIISLIKSVRNYFFNDILSRLVRQNEEKKNSNSNSKDSYKENLDLRLIESIEELGYIPSIDKKNDENVA